MSLRMRSPGPCRLRTDRNFCQQGRGTGRFFIGMHGEHLSCERSPFSLGYRH